jgi:ABC-type Fe3+ transport system substrate-binding protein
MDDQATVRPRVSRRAFLQALVVGNAVALAACQAPATAPASSRAAGTSTPGAASGPVTHTADAAAGWEQQWNDWIASARQGGQLVLAGPPNPDLRVALPAKFKERFGVEMEYVALPANQGEFIERLIKERAAGLGTVNVLVGGAQSIYTVAYPERVMAPIRPVLIHPEALDDSKWTVGKVWFKDPDDTYFLQIANSLGGQIIVNTNAVSPGEMTAWRDLLRPSYAGKISVWDPTLPGSGWNTANWLRTTFGDDFFKQLYVDQRPGITTDLRQWSDWLARGTYPIALGLGARDFQALKKDGFPVEVVPSFSEAPGTVSAAWGIVVLLENAPNPGAAKWIAIREGQETWHRADQTPSIRTDVENSWAPSHIVPQPGVEYFDTYGWDYVTTAFGESIPRIRQIMALRQ